MKKGVIIVFVGLVGVLLSVQQWKNEPSVSELPVVSVRKMMSAELKLLTAQVDELKATKWENRAQVEEKYAQVRLSFKQIEFLLAYLDPELFNQNLNGAPLPKLMKNVADVQIIQPKGLQRMQELISEDELDKEELTDQLEKFGFHISKISEGMLAKQISDPVIFESIRFGLIRIFSLGVTGFDSPANTEKALEENARSLEGMQNVVNYYAPYLEENTKTELDRLFAVGIAQLRKDDFDSFNRLTFLTKVINPLWKLTLEAQQKLHVELPHQRNVLPTAVNYQAENLFANNFIDVSFYADFIKAEKQQEAIELGRFLFFDPVLSSNNQRACASCHQPGKAFTDGFERSLTTDEKAPGLRNAPTLLNSIISADYFYDLRADRLSQQMDHVVFNPTEFNTDYGKIIAKLKQSDEYIQLFTEVYGNEGITKNSVTNAVANYVGSLYGYNSTFDKYVRKEIPRLPSSVERGFNLFAGKAACATCHFMPTFAGTVPPNFEESETEVLGVPNKPKAPFSLDSDLGRYAGNNAKGRVEFYKFSFKTPTLRNIELTGPYMHNGVYQTLEEVVEFYNNGGGVGLGFDVPYQTLSSDSLHLTKREQRDLIDFMKALTDTSGMTYMPTKLPSFPANAGLNQRKIGGEY